MLSTYQNAQIRPSGKNKITTQHDANTGITPRLIPMNVVYDTHFLMDKNNAEENVVDLHDQVSTTN